MGNSQYWDDEESEKAFIDGYRLGLKESKKNDTNRTKKIR